MSLWTTLGDAFGLGSDIAGAVQSPQDQQYLTQIPIWKAAALRGDTTAYANLQCVAGTTQYGACNASGYVQGVARAAVQEVDASVTLAHGAGQGAGVLTAIGNALNPQGFWNSYAGTLGVSVQSFQLSVIAVVGLVLWLVLRRGR